MDLACEQRAGSTVMRLIGNMSVGELSEAHEALCRSMQECEPIVLDLNDVTSCDTAALQFLISAIRTSSESKRIAIPSVPLLFSEAADCAGIDLEGLNKSLEVISNE